MSGDAQPAAAARSEESAPTAANPRTNSDEGGSQGEPPRWLESGILLLMAVASIVIVGFTLSLTNRGFDLTDESYYIASIKNAGRYSTSVTQFGFVYHPIHLIVRGSVSALRQINIVITVLLTTAVGWLTLEMVGWPGGTQMRGAKRAVTAIALGATSVGMLSQWLPTPSYNSLALQSILLAIAAIILIGHGSSRRAITGSILLGTSGVGLLLAKPASALLLAIAVVAYFAVADRRNLRPLGSAVVFSAGLLLIVTLLIDGSPAAFVDRMRSGIEIVQLQDPAYTLGRTVRLDRLAWASDLRALFFFIVSLSALGGIAVSAQGRAVPWWRAGLFVFLPLTAVLISLGVFTFSWPSVLFSAVLYASVPLGAALVAFTIRASGTRTSPNRRVWGIVLLLAVSPYIYAYGSNNNYWQAGSIAGILWVLAGVTLVGAVGGRAWKSRLLVAVLAGQVVATVLLQMGAASPYRQPVPITAMTVPVFLRANATTVFAADSFGRYAEGLQRTADAGGFRPDMQLLDLTGRTPGAAVLLGANATGSPWLIGGYPGSQAAAERVLDLTACSEISRAWILDEPNGDRRLDSSLMRRYGRDLDADYVVVGTVTSPDGQTQRLLRPRDDSPVASGPCSSD